MESIAKSDIFFMVTSLCVVIITVLVAMILFHILRIVRIARKIADKFECQAEGLADDFSKMRDMLRENQFGLKPLAEAFKRKTTRRKKKEAPVNEE